jgi:hypothetical protein
MKSPADDLAGFLESKGIGSRRATAGWNISVGTEPAAPTTAVTLYDTGGGAPDTGELDVFNPTVQVRVRGNSYPEAYAKARDVHAGVDPRARDDTERFKVRVHNGGDRYPVTRQGRER